MKYLFVQSNMKFLSSLAFTDTLYAFDYDGTLSKIVKYPDAAQIAPKTQKLLSQLGKIADVAVISGRGLVDLKSRIRSDHLKLIGNHGIEGFDANVSELESIKKICQTWCKQLATTWLQKLQDPYVELENKKYSLSLHYRRSRKKKKARDLALKAISKLDPRPRLIFGKCVINILPNHSPHKGNAIIELVKESRTKKVFYIGDDDTDEFVFGMNDVKVFSVRVGQSRNSKAMFYIKNQSQINKLLSSLIKIISAPSKKTHGGQRYDERNYQSR